MNSILAAAYPKKLAAKKKPAKKDAAVSTAITEVTTADGVGDTRPEAASLNQTAAQAVACVAVKLAKLVAGNHGGSKTAKAFAQEIVDVDDTDGMLFLPTEVNITSNLSVIQRVWTKLFQDGRYTMPPAAKKGVISRFVNELNNDDFELVATAVAVRIGRIGKEKAKETGESAAKVQEATRVEAATERVRESIAVSVAQTDETEKEKAAAKVKYSNGYICPSGHTHYVNCISKDGLPMELPCGFVDNSLTPCVLVSRRMTAKEKWAEDKALRERLAAIVAEEKETLADIRQQEKAAAV